MRTAEDFLDDMLKGGRDWIEILTVAGEVRHGLWRLPVEQMLLDRKLMPESKQKRADLVDARLKERKAAEKAAEDARILAKKKAAKPKIHLDKTGKGVTV